MAVEFVDDTTTKKRIARDKEKVLKELEQNPTPSAVAQKVGISHSTYYRWLKDDPDFAEKARQAEEIGMRRYTDMAVAKMGQKISEGDIRALIYWISHNHPKFRNTPAMTEAQATEMIERQNYVEQVLIGNLPVKHGRFLLSYFKHMLNERRTKIIQKVLGGQST